MAARMIRDWKQGRPDDTNEDELHKQVLEVLVSRATSILQDHGILYQARDKPLKPICLCQPHHSKKEIMFSSFLFTLALARANSITFIWSSDSDSMLYTAATPIHRVLAAMSADESIAGSCGALQIHNAPQSTITRLISATYHTDLSLTSGQNSAFDVTDCQPGPCAAFRAAALQEILVPWYTQTFWGVRPLVNEDRHLSTRLLLRGYKVTFNPAGTVLTDAPTTFATWIVQQVRWSRAIVLETLAHPRMFIDRNPILSIYALRRIVGPYLQAWIILRYLYADRGTSVTSPWDISARILLCSVYTLRRHGGGWRLWPWLVASQIFLQFPQPPIVIWASATFLDGSWGTAMRSNVEQEKAQKSVFRKHFAPLLCIVIWVALIGATVGKYLASMALVGYEAEKLCAVIGAAFTGSSVLYILLCGY